MSVEPRALFKQYFYKVGCLSTEPTETGANKLDKHHPSYRVIHINNEPFCKFENDDRMFDILHNEKRGYITVRMKISNDEIDQFINSLKNRYSPAEYPADLKAFYNKMLRSMLHSFLLPEIQKDVKEELAESAENFAISKC